MLPRLFGWQSKYSQRPAERGIGRQTCIATDGEAMNSIHITVADFVVANDIRSGTLIPSVGVHQQFGRADLRALPAPV